MVLYNSNRMKGATGAVK